MGDGLDPIIQQAYDIANIDGKYDNFRDWNNKLYKREHYAMTNIMEYFAESTEAFFSSRMFRNDFYPFIH